MKKILKIFIVLTIVGGVFTLYQFLGQATYNTTSIKKVNYELSKKKVDVDFKIEKTRGKLEDNTVDFNSLPKSNNRVETSKELKKLIAERDAIIKQMNARDAKEKREAKAEEEKTKTENLRLLLSFWGTLASTFATVVIAWINSRKK